MRKSYFLLIICIIGLGFINFSWNKSEFYNQNTIDNKKSNKVKMYYLLGMKKIGSDIVLLKLTNSIALSLEKNQTKYIVENSNFISDLNPYLLDNYYVSANALVFSSTSKNIDEALKILNKGIENNPKDSNLKKYMTGLIWSTKGNDEEVLKNYEEILYTYPDPLMIKAVYDIYFKKVKEDRKYIEKYLYYASKLYENDKYKKNIERDLKIIEINKK